MSTQVRTKLLTKRLIITSLVAGFLLVIVNSAIWTNRQIFNTQNFTNTATESITSEPSREAIGARITDEVLKDRPILRNIAGDQITNLISGLLGTDQSSKLLTAAVSKMQIYVTSKNQQDVDVDISGLKNTLTKISELNIVDDTNRVNVESIPDRIVLIQEENVPNLYNIGVTLNWLAPVGFLLAAVLLALPYLANRKDYVFIMTIQGAVIAFFGFIALLIGPLLKPSVLEPFRNVNGRTVVGNLYDAFIDTFNSQTRILIFVGLLVCLVALGIKLLPQVKKLRR